MDAEWWRMSQSFGDGGSLLQCGPYFIVPFYVGESEVSIGSRAGVASVTLVPDDGVHISSQNSV